MHLHKKISQSFVWNSIEAITYQTILFAHQWYLFKVIPIQMYGHIGSLFAVSYMSAHVISGGFDAAITPFFAQATQSKRLFNHIIFSPLKHHSAIVSIVAGSALITWLLVMGWNNYVWYVALLAIIEGLRKVAKTIAQLLFKAKLGMLIELVAIISYTSCVWSGYSYGCNLSVFSVIIPLLLTSLGALLAYTILIYRWYCTLPHHEPDTNDNQLIQLRSGRIMNFINQITHVIFSSNTLVAWIAVHLGFEQAGIFKFMSHLCYFITSILQKTFGYRAHLIFTYIKHYTYQEKISVLTRLNKRFIIVVTTLILFLIINIQTIAGFSETYQAQFFSWVSMVLFMLLILSENFVIMYEKFCIAEGFVHYLVVYALVSCGGFYLAAWHITALSFNFLLGGLLLVRLCSLGLLTLLVDVRYQQKNHAKSLTNKTPTILN